MLVILVLFLSPIFLSIVIFLMSVASHIIIFVSYVKLGPLLTVTLDPSSHARNLGVVLESDLSLDRHISNVCRFSYHHIRQLRQVRSSLDRNSRSKLSCS